MLVSQQPILLVKPATASGVSSQGRVAAAAAAAADLWITVGGKQVISPVN